MKKQKKKKDPDNNAITLADLRALIDSVDPVYKTPSKIKLIVDGKVTDIEIEKEEE